VVGRLLLRLFGAAVFGFAGWELSFRVEMADNWLWLALFTFCGAAFGFALIPEFTVRPLRWARRQINRLPANSFVAGTIGLLVGLFASALLAVPLSMLPGILGQVLPVAATLVLCYLSISAMMAREREFGQLIGSYITGAESAGAKAARRNGHQVILDTSAIIDGRIADISQTGFIQGALVIPRFVLDELRHIADSPDSVRRNRGRRGLEMLTKLQKESDIPVQISDFDVEGVREVDAKLVHLAKVLRCPIVTNDFNLNRVAELQGVKVLNINELANAVKPAILPGEEMRVRVIQEGREMGQGVGFLDDGTMVVVEGGRRYLNGELDIIITRVLQTAAGRMIFAHPKAG